MTDKESALFPIKRGTKQGDPVSSLLFNTELHFAFEDDLKKWQDKKQRHTFERQKRRLPNKFTICCRHATVLHLSEQIERHVV